MSKTMTQVQQELLDSITVAGLTKYHSMLENVNQFPCVIIDPEQLEAKPGNRGVTLTNRYIFTFYLLERVDGHASLTHARDSIEKKYRTIIEGMRCTLIEGPVMFETVAGGNKITAIKMKIKA